jgi:hypothetical protein
MTTRKWIIDLIYPEALDKVIKLNTELAQSNASSRYEIGDSQKVHIMDWVGVYFVGEDVEVGIGAFLRGNVDCFVIVAFDEKWKRKAIVDPSLRDDIIWIRSEDALNFIKANKPKNEHWLIQIAESPKTVGRGK